jgi:hypothetical protein
MRFNPQVEHVPGKSLVIAVALSCSPLPHSSKDEESADEVTQYVDSIQALWPVSSRRLDLMRAATQSDEQLAQILCYVHYGWPRSLPASLQEFEQHKNELSSMDRLLIFHNHIVIPTELRAEMIDILHESYQGLTKYIENAHTCMWWPGSPRTSR